MQIRIVNNNFYFLFFVICLLFFEEIISLIFLGSIPQISKDKLDGVIVFNKIISQFYTNNFESSDIFLNGNLKWYNFDRVFNPLIFLYALFEFKNAYFIENIIFKSFGFYSFYKLGKFYNLEKILLILISTFFALIVFDIYPYSLFVLTYPYLAYVIFKNKTIKLRNYLVLVFAASCSSLVFEIFPLLIFFFLIIIFFNTELKKKNIYITFALIFLVLLLFNFYLFLNFISEPNHRVEWIIDTNLISRTFDNIKSSLYLNYTKIDFIFFFPRSILAILIFFISFKYYQDFYIRKFLKIFLFLFAVIEISVLIKLFLITFDSFSFLKSIQIVRISRIQPLFLFTLTCSVFLIFQNGKLITYIKYFLVFGIIVVQLKSFSYNTLRILVYSNFSFNEIKNIKRTLQSKKNNFHKLKNIYPFLNNLKLSNISFERSKYILNFDNYYKFEIYNKIKRIVKNDRVLSVNIDPMIAVANNIYVADGYHQIYPLNYKHEFRKIIERELNENLILKKYFDEWGSRVYTWVTNPNNIKLNFDQIRKLDIRFIISSKNLEHKFLYEIFSERKNKQNIKLYKIKY